MNAIVDRALARWAEAVASDDGEARATFAAVYTDPVLVNGILTRSATSATRSSPTSTAETGAPSPSG